MDTLSNERLILLKYASWLTIGCMAFILVAALTDNAHDFLYYQKINFTFNPAPTFSDLLITSDIHLDSQFYLIQKTGHITAFGLLYSFLFLRLRKVKTAVVICFLFAISTEVLQLFFSRNGRLYDVGIDMIGVFAGYLWMRLVVWGLVEVKPKCQEE